MGKPRSKGYRPTTRDYAVNCWLQKEALVSLFQERLVLVVGEDEERQCAQLRMLQSRVELVAGGLEVLIRRGAVQHEDDALRPLKVETLRATTL
ncbi:hypothetical protein EYF80_052297 [Liparis tanakae]|uniref:Uncharacterized protein n=1 Tax=Liparis tanakae TaxID=230148 RepID=A0A4Z2F9S1_9TELE|nr:hypothetical protein EYF80_052297 [Liparis tanakae]